MTYFSRNTYVFFAQIVLRLGQSLDLFFISTDLPDRRSLVQSSLRDIDQLLYLFRIAPSLPRFESFFNAPCITPTGARRNPLSRFCQLIAFPPRECRGAYLFLSSLFDRHSHIALTFDPFFFLLSPARAPTGPMRPPFFLLRITVPRHVPLTGCICPPFPKIPSLLGFTFFSPITTSA